MILIPEILTTDVGSEAAPPETGGGYKRLQLKPRTKPVEKETREDPLAKFWYRLYILYLFILYVSENFHRIHL